MDKIFKERFNDFKIDPPEHILTDLKSEYNKVNYRNNRFFNAKNMLFTVSGVIIIAAIVMFTDLFPGNNVNNSIESSVITANNSENVKSVNLKENTDNKTNTKITNNTSITKNNNTSNNIEEIETAKISMKAAPVVEAGKDITVCGLSTKLNAKAVKGYDCSWKTDNNINIEDISNPNTKISASDYGKYKLGWEVKNKEYAKKDYVYITFIRSDDFSVSYTVTKATCHNNNGSVNIDAEGGSGSYEYYWNNSDTPGPSYRDDLAAGTYKIRVKDGGDCMTTIEAVVKDSGIVKADFNHSELSLSVDVPVYFTNLSNIDGQPVSELDYFTNVWYFGDNNKSTEDNPYHNYISEGKYRVVLYVTSAAGCVDSAFTMLTISGSSLEVPNIFTPNGDGINDIFTTKYKSLETFKGYIISKHGKVIFEWNDPEKGWDGKLKDGTDAEIGTYYYIIRGQDTKGKVYEYKNFFYLNR